MTSPADATRAREATSRPGLDLSWDNPDWNNEARQPRDWKKLFLVIGLGILSWVATYVGMLELIEANMGELPLQHKVIIGFSVAMLMTMVIWLLDQMFSSVGFVTRLAYIAGYIFLSIISVGFGFGFYWKVLESRSVASTSAETAVSLVQNSLFAASTRLDQLTSTLEQLVAVSKTKADTERASGTSCPSSKPGEGPRRRLREEDAARFGFGAEFVKTRAGAVKGEMAGLDAELLKIVSDDRSIVDARSGTRNEFMKGLGRKLELTVTGFNTFRGDPQLKQIRQDLAERAERTSFPDGKGGTFLCPDTQLQAALKGVVRAIDELPGLEKPRIATVEGSEAVVEAFRRLTATFYGALSFKLPPTAEELRELQKKAMEQVDTAGGKPRPAAVNMEQAGLSKRDYIPLAIAIFVDICLLLVSIGRPVNRLQGLVPKMRAAERGPVIQILSRFNQIHRDAEIRENFEIFRHVVFDFNGDYYVAVPLDAPARMNPAQREDLRIETAILSNLFASFEQEKIFARVLMPLLPVTSIRKRLRRQGSKFAEAEAFRIYKFKDGAWSEIILGAIMGAARRVEAEKRRRRVEDDIFRPTAAPELDASSARTAAGRLAQPTQAQAASHPDAREAFASFTGGRHDSAPRFAPPEAAPGPPAHAAASFGPYARFVRPRPEQESGGPAASAASRGPYRTAAPADARAQPRAAHDPAWPEPGSATTAPHATEPAGEAANSNTEPHRPNGAGATVASAPATSNVIAMPAPATAPPPAADAPVAPAEPLTARPAREPAHLEATRLVATNPAPTVTVAAVERTFTYQMPAGDLAMPPAISALAARSAALAAAARGEPLHPPLQLELQIEPATVAAVTELVAGIPHHVGPDGPSPDEEPMLQAARRFAPMTAAE